MQHIAGKLSTSSFQRYEVCMNRSSDERVMAPGSRGIGAVFVHLSGEDSDQMGDAFGKPRVPRRSWSRYLSNAPGLVDQLAASRKDSAREGGCPGGKTRFPPSAFFFKSCPSSGFAEIRAWTCEIWFREPEATGVFLVRLRAVFRSGFRLDPIKSWRSESSTSCMSVSSFQRTRACGSTCCESGRLCAQAWQRRFDHNFLVSRPFWARKVSNRSSHYVLQNGPGAVSSIQFSVWSTVRSNLGQTWSTLVEFGQNSPNSGKCIPNRVSRVFGPDGPQSGWERLGQTLECLMRPGFVGSYGLGPGRPAMRADTRENPVGLRSTISFRLYVLQWVVGAIAGPIALRKARSVIYAPESPPDTDDEYDAMEDVRTRVDASLARDLQAEFDAEAAGLSSSTARPSSRPGITIGRSARPSSAPRQPTAAPPAAPPARSKRRKSDRDPLSADPIPEDHVVPGFRYPPQGGIRPRYPVTTPVADTLLLTDLHNHPSSSVRRCQDPPESIGRGGWSEFSQLLDIARPEYRDFLVELGFGPFLSIRYVHVRHPLVRCWVERFFHHTGTIHLSTARWGCSPLTGVPF
uniref:Aminotransferase-like plant mobile domain-containing protein n=1 Tax=Fagus sylvatica TaxID=28930 RepID=A0A2N9HFW0_FAGSY